MSEEWLTGLDNGEKRDERMIKNIYTAVMLFLVMVLLIGGVYVNSIIEVFTV